MSVNCCPGPYIWVGLSDLLQGHHVGEGTRGDFRDQVMSFRELLGGPWLLHGEQSKPQGSWVWVLW